MDTGLPQINQSAYRRGVSCADTIFATQGVISGYLKSGSKVYMSLYDLQKAFDSVEYLVNWLSEWEDVEALEEFVCE